VRTVEAGTKHSIAFFLCPCFAGVRVFLVKPQLNAATPVQGSPESLGEWVVMIGMIRVQLEKVPVMFKNRKILVRTMNLHAEDFFQESRSFPDIFYQEVYPETLQAAAKLRCRRFAGNAFIQTLLPDSSIPLSTNAKAGIHSRLFWPTDELDVKQSNVSY
jgi:hypothetical protein